MSSTSRGSRMQPLAAAILFAASFLFGVFALTTPDFNAPDATWVAFWNDRSNRVVEIAAAYALLVAGGALVWFASQLGRHVGSRVVSSAGWAAAVMLWVGAVFLSAVPAAMSISGAPAPGADIDRIVTDMGAAALAMFAVPVAAFAVAAAARAGLRTGSLPRWLCWLGFVVAVLLVTLGGAVFPLPLLPVWAVLTGASVAFRRKPGVAVAAAAA